MVETHLPINDPAFVASPWAALAELREGPGIFYDPTWNKVFLMRHQDMVGVLRDRRFGRSILHVLSRDELGWPPPNPLTKDFDHFQENHPLDLEPPRHTRLRSLVAKVFTLARSEGLRPRIQAIADGLLAQLGPSFDVVRDYAETIPVEVIAELLGVPIQDRHLLRPWSSRIVKLYELGYSEAQATDANNAVLEFSGYLRDLAEHRRKHPSEDLISALVQVEEAGERLSMDELVATCILLLNAGHEATVNGTGLAVLALLREPDKLLGLQRVLRQDPNHPVLKTAIDEFLRFESPLPMFERWVLEDMVLETTGGPVKLRQGQEVVLMYASGNRDPRRFENADTLDLTRQDNPHLTFGLGTHYCLGAPLARIEMGVTLSGLLRHAPKLELAEVPRWGKGFVIRGLESLPVQTVV